MKRALRAFGVAMALAAPVALQAQASSDKPISFGVSGGLSILNGDIADGYESGYSVAGHVGIKPAGLKSLRFRGDVSFDRWGAKRFDDISLRSLGIAGNAIYDFPVQSASTIRPYILGGVGVYNVKVSADNGDSWTKAGLQAGGGVEFRLSGFSTFVEAKYVNVFTEGFDLRYTPITFGVRF